MEKDLILKNRLLASLIILNSLVYVKLGIAAETQTFTLIWGNVEHADHFRLEERIADSGDDWTHITPSEHTSHSLTKEYGNYEYRVIGCLDNPEGVGAPLCEEVAEYSDIYPLKVNESTGQAAWFSLGGTAEDITVDSPVVPANAQVGELPGQATASGGAAKYAVPITVPPGRNGMSPDISLTYSSRSGNGVMGVGWNVTGISAIHRCSATFAQDGYRKIINYDSDDKLCLDGQRLVRVAGGDYGKDTAEYRTEIDSFAKVIQNGDINGESSFTVYHNNGLVSHFGATADSKHKPAGKTEILNWSISKQLDPAGNNMTFVYASFGAGEHYISAIHYTGFGDSEGNRHVVFGYDDRTDIQSFFSAGGNTQSTKLLKNITTKYIDETVLTYTVNYDTSAATQRSLVSDIQVCGSSTCLPATHYEWQDNSIDYALEPVTFTNVAGDQYQPFSGSDYGYIDQIQPYKDVNRDGVLDWPVQFMPSPHWTSVRYDHGYTTNAEGEQTGTHALSRGECRPGHYSPVGSSFAGKTCDFADYNQDGIADTWRLNNKVFEIGLGNEDFSIDWQSTLIDLDEVRTTTVVGLVHRILDMNGDGWPDVIVQRKYLSATPQYENDDNRQTLEVYFHTGNVASPYTTTSTEIYEYEVNSFGRAPTQGPSAYVGASNTQPQFIDIDGNGLLDIVNLRTGSDELVYGDYGLSFPDGVQLTKNGSSPGHIIQESRSLRFYSVPYYSIFLDVNGDGLQDWLAWRFATRSFALKINKGAGIFTAEIPLGTEADWPALVFNRGPNAQEGPERTISERQAIPVMMNAIKVMDVNMDGRDELLLPGTRLVEGCANYAQYGGIGADGYVEFDSVELCGDEIYQPLHIGGTNFAPPDHRFDRSIHKFDAIYFNDSADGTLSIDKTDSGIISALYDNAVVDAFGDGLSDMLFIYGNAQDPNVRTKPATGAMVGFNGQYGAYMMRNRGAASTGQRFAAPDLLVSTTSGLGVQSSWDYKPLSSGLITSNGLSLYGIDNQYVFGALGEESRYFNFASSMYVVSEFKQSNGVSGTNDKHYGYRGAVFNGEGRGFHGFRTVIEDDLASGLRTVSDFHQKFPLSGSIESSRTCLISENDESCSDQNPISESNYGYMVFDTQATETATSMTTTADILANNESILPEVKWVIQGKAQQVRRAIEDRTVTLSETVRYLGEADPGVDWNALSIAPSSFDLYGNTLVSTNINHDGFSQTSRTTTNDYAEHDTASWWINKLDSTIVLSKTIAESEATGSIYDATLDPEKEVKTEYTWVDAVRKPDLMTVSVLKGGGLSVKTDTDYNAYGLPKSVTSMDPSVPSNKRTSTTTYSNNGADESVDGYFVYETVNALLHKTTHTTSPQLGVVLSSTDPNGITSTSTYDDFARPQSHTVQSEAETGSAISLPTAYTRFLACNGCGGMPTAKYKVVKYQAGTPQSETLFDSHNRPLLNKIQNFAGTEFSYQRTDYDNRGNVVFSSIVADTLQQATSTGTRYGQYDSLGRPIGKTTNYSGGNLVATYTYSGHKTEITAEAGEKTLTMSREFDGAGRLRQTVDALSGSTTYAYDALGNPIVIKDAKGSLITAVHNGLGQKTLVNDPNMGSKSFTYTVFGEIKSTTDANNDVVKFVYDELGRMTSRLVNNIDTDSFTFDSCTNGIGQLCELSGSGKTESYTFDPLSRTITTTTKISGDPTVYTSAYGYDGATGQLRTERYPVSGLTLDYQYNAQGYLSKLVNAESGFIYQQIEAQNAQGRIQQAALNNGLTQHIASYFNETGQMDVLTISSSDGTELKKLDYGYDGFGNLSTQDVDVLIADEVVSSTESYLYDGLHRLIKSSRTIGGHPVPVIEYDYDAVGNFQFKTDYTEKSLSAYQYGSAAKALRNAGPNAVTQVNLADGGSILYGYDKNGNRTHVNGVNDIKFNVHNKPIEINKSGVKSVFSYGADLARFKQVKTGLSNGTKTTTYISKSFEKVEYDGAIEYRHYIGDVAILTQKKVGVDTTHKIGYTHRDRLGSTVATTNHLGNLTSSKSFDPFGKPRLASMENVLPASLQDVASQGSFTLLSDRGFTDHEHLDEAELIHMNGRVYDYNLGQFLSVDPIVHNGSQGINPYSYIMNNPLSGVDPTGYACDATRIGTSFGSGCRGSDRLSTAANNQLMDSAISLGVIASTNVNNGRRTSGHSSGNSSELMGGGYLTSLFDELGSNGFRPYLSEEQLNDWQQRATSLQGELNSIVNSGPLTQGDVSRVGLLSSKISALENEITCAFDRCGLVTSTPILNLLGSGTLAKMSVNSVRVGVTKSVDPNSIRFSQSSVNGAGDLTQSMKANGWKGDAIDVVKMDDGALTTLDNTRVLAASRAGVNVQANIRNATDALPANMVERFTTKKGVPSTWGEAAQLRIGKQSAGWRNGNSNGSMFTRSDN